ncbi:MAG: hypothetical protein ACRD2A_00805 [Vicinamibacterales bacterium]
MLRLVSAAEADYFTPPAPRPSAEPPWKKGLRLLYFILFLAVWLEGVASFYYFGIAFRGGAVRPNALQAEPLSDHGKVVYITSSQKRLVETLLTGMAIGIPSAMLLGVILHFIVGVRLFPNARTLEEWRRPRDDGQP